MFRVITSHKLYVRICDNTCFCFKPSEESWCFSCLFDILVWGLSLVWTLSLVWLDWSGWSAL
uniref:Uncharacterized protein n=1 Tax=Anguilla anguilla TaxID=7936 RepID=A0A0E9QZ41_ANGAN